MQFYGFTDMGNVRDNNEDYFAAKEISAGLFAFVVADGMGGHNCGEKASSSAVEIAVKSIEDAAKFFESYTDKQIEGFLKNMVVKLNKELYTKAISEPLLNGMGTTLVVCIVYKNKYYTINIGDSRMYIYSDSLNQITKDHSFVEELVEMGFITKEEALNHPNKNVITRAVGTEQSIVPDFYKGKLNENDTIIICTDGLTNMVNDTDIAGIIKEKTNAEDITKELVSKAKNNGGIDNITVVCIKSTAGGELTL